MRIHRTIAVLCSYLLMTVLASCAPETALHAEAKVVERKLAWVEQADAQSIYAVDSAASKHRFLSICGYACVVPGVGKLTAQYCFSRVEIQPIEGTSDVILSDRHSMLMQRAAEVAAKYNKLVAQTEATKGYTTCSPDANFDEAFFELHSLVQTTYSSDVASTFSMATRVPNFQITIPLSQISAGFENAACAVLKKHDLPVDAHILALSKSGQSTAERVFKCEGKSAT